MGSGLEDWRHPGPLIDDAAVAKVEAHTGDAVSKGAHVVKGGGRQKASGRFFQPTVPPT